MNNLTISADDFTSAITTLAFFFYMAGTLSGVVLAYTAIPVCYAKGRRWVLRRFGHRLRARYRAQRKAGMDDWRDSHE